MMKRMMAAIAFFGVSMASFAQETVPVQKYSVATNSFWSNWFIQIGGDYNAWYSNQEHGLGLDNGKHYSLFAKQRRTFGGSIAVGKWFSPGLGMRTKLQVGNAKKMGIADVSSLKFWTINEQILFNMSNLLCGYNPNRVWNVTTFVGGGVSRNESISLYAMLLSAGINSSWKLSRHVDLYTELGWNRMEEDFDGYDGYNNRSKHHGYGWEDKDNHLYAELG
ncbi:MAG: OmpA family protein, partial [Prevotella salivae]|nr:OmpA family protein [Segatella salivae]